MVVYRRGTFCWFQRLQTKDVSNQTDIKGKKGVMVKPSTFRTLTDRPTDRLIGRPTDRPFKYWWIFIDQINRYTNFVNKGRTVFVTYENRGREFSISSLIFIRRKWEMREEHLLLVGRKSKEIRTDGQTDRQTDKLSYWVALSRKKKWRAQTKIWVKNRRASCMNPTDRCEAF